LQQGLLQRAGVGLARSALPAPCLKHAWIPAYAACVYACVYAGLARSPLPALAPHASRCSVHRTSLPSE
jgi:hypothetical protein